MRYRAVMTGTQMNLIEDIFVALDDILECITSSTIPTDLERHIQYYGPEVLIVCLNDDTLKMAKLMTQIQWKLDEKSIVVVVIGSQESIDLYNKNVEKNADIYLAKPLKNSTIVEVIENHMKEREQEKEALRLKEEQRLAMSNKPNILVVDDDPNMLALIKEQLEGDYKIATAVNGGLALRYLTKKTADLILLDYEMPIQSGPQVMKIIRNNESTKDVPVVFLTGVKDTEKIKDVLELRPQGYLLKPIDNKKLRDTIAEILGE